MVGKALLDTDIFSEVLKGIDRGVAVKAESYLRSFGAFTLSVISINDPMIAAAAIRQGLTLVTGNTDHFQRIKNLGYPLALDNWRIV